MISEVEARAKALAAGIEEHQITPQILAYYGYTVSNPVAGMQAGAVVLPEQVKTDLEALEAARIANQVPAQILASVTGLLGWAKQSGILALSVMLTLLLLCSSCGDQRAAMQSMERLDMSVTALNNQHLEFEDRFIEEFETQTTNKILDLDAAARKSAETVVTEMVEEIVDVPVKAADGTDAFKKEKRMVAKSTEMIPTNVARALDAQKATLFTNMMNIVVEMRQTQAKICENAANAAMYMKALQNYFSQKQTTYESLMAAQNSVKDMLEIILKPRDKK